MQSDDGGARVLHKFIVANTGACSPHWCLLFVLIRHGFRGGPGPQRWIRALGEETGNPIMAFHRPSFSLSLRGHPTTLPPRIPCWAVILRLNSVAGFAEPALSLIGLTQKIPQTLPRGFTLPSFRDQTSGHRETEAAHPLVTGDALPCSPISIGDM